MLGKMWSRWVHNARDPSYCRGIGSPPSDDSSGAVGVGETKEEMYERMMLEERQKHRCRSLQKKMVLIADGAWKMAQQKVTEWGEERQERRDSHSDSTEQGEVRGRRGAEQK